ncbi:MAG: hypothetical protein KY453_10900 [Gemmatimonadetes bacterium]|nr:hypothetical protein [Gemmatimonadota bacterium]
MRRPRLLRTHAAAPGLRVALAGIAVAASLAAVACGGDSPTGPPPALRELPRALTTTERAAVAGSNRFAWDLLRRVHEAAPDSSAFLSPLSASVALAMTAMGADGDTWTQMRDMLGFQGVERDAMAQAYAGLTDLILGLDPTVELAVANALWHRRGEVLETPFLDAVRTHFDARVEGLDFGDPAALGTINGWVEDATRGRIDEIVKTIPGNVVLYLMNAVYFKGSWRYRFDPADTRTADFHTGEGEAAPVRMMYSS